MSKHNIKSACELAGISRSHFYKEYIDTGKISIDRNNPKKPLIDTSELLRVFPELHDKDMSLQDTKNTTGHEEKAFKDTKNAAQNALNDSTLHEMEKRLLILEGENKLLASEKQSAERERHNLELLLNDQREQINKQLDIINRSQLLLEDKSSQAEKLAVDLEQQNLALSMERKKSWWAKLIGG
jgi:hypothetical protein